MKMVQVFVYWGRQKRRIDGSLVPIQRFERWQIGREQAHERARSQEVQE
jgi:hypothetical protein